MRDDPRERGTNAFALAAPALLAAGHSPLPLQPGTKRCVEQGWSGYCLKQPSEQQVATWSQRPGAGVGVATGNGLIAIDIDTDDPNIITVIRSVIPKSLVAKHGAKGRTDFYFDPTRSLVARKIRDAAGKSLVEVLAVGCQTVVPPTLHPKTHKPYTYLTRQTLADTRRESLPDVPVDFLPRLEVALQRWTAVPSRPVVGDYSRGGSTDGRAWALKALEREAAKIRRTQPGGRNPQLFSSACAVGRYVHHGLLSEQEFVAAFLGACQANGLLDEDGLRQCRATIQKGLDKARNDVLPHALLQMRPTSHEGIGFGKREQPAGPGHNSGEAIERYDTERDMALAFAGKYADHIRFDHDQRSWFYWDDDVWSKDQAAYVFHLIQNFCALHAGAQRQHFSSNRGIQNVEVLIQKQPSIAVRQELWDSHNMVLGCRRGYVHLDTGLIAAPEPKLFITKLASVSPAPGRPPDLWLQVLDHWCGSDPELIRFLQQMCGYLLTGDTSEQKFFFLRGPSATGKGTFAHVLYEIMKDHAAVGDERLLALGGRFSIDEALASARGARLYLFDELPRGFQVNDALLKRLTGESGSRRVRSTNAGSTTSPRTKSSCCRTMTPAFPPVVRPSSAG